MPVKEFLDQFRNAAGELTLMKRALQATPEPTCHDAYLSPQVRRVRTRVQRSRLRELVQASQCRWDLMNDEFEVLLAKCYATSIQKAILWQYYGAAMTDAEIAGLLGLSPKTVTGHRMRWVHRAEDLQASAAQKQM